MKLNFVVYRVLDYIKYDVDQECQEFALKKSDDLLENYHKILPFIDAKITESKTYEKGICAIFSDIW